MTVRLISADQVVTQRWRSESAKADSAIAASWLTFDSGAAAA